MERCSHDLLARFRFDVQARVTQRSIPLRYWTHRRTEANIMSPNSKFVKRLRNIWKFRLRKTQIADGQKAVGSLGDISVELERFTNCPPAS